MTLVEFLGTNRGGTLMVLATFALSFGAVAGFVVAKGLVSTLPGLHRRWRLFRLGGSAEALALDVIEKETRKHAVAAAWAGDLEEMRKYQGACNVAAERKASILRGERVGQLSLTE